MIHNLKCQQLWFDDIINGKKQFEIRKDDRNYEVGDFILLEEWNPEIKKYSGRGITITITYLIRNMFFLKDGYCAFGFKKGRFI